MHKKSDLKNYLSYMYVKLKGYKKFIPIILISSLLLSMLSIFISIVSKTLIDNILFLETKSLIKIVVISIVGYLLGALLGFGGSYLQKYFIDKYKMSLQMSFYDNMQRSEFIFFNDLSSSDIYYRMFNDISIMVDFFINLTLNMPIKIITFIIVFVVMCLWSIELTFAILLLVLVQVIIMMGFRKPIKQKSEKSIESDQRLITKINDDILKSDMCRSLALENFNYKNVAYYFDDARKNRLKYSKFNLLYTTLLSLSSQVLNICLMLLGIHYVSISKITIGTLMAFSMLAGYLYQPLTEIFSIVISYQPTKISFERFNSFNESVDLSRLSGKEKFQNGNIEIENLGFSYGNQEIFSNLNLTLKSGMIYFIQGENGIGKTTLARLLARYIIPQKGVIKLGNVSVDEIDFEEYRKNVIPVFSDSILLKDTLYNNLTLQNDYKEEDLLNIIKNCALENLVSKLDKGINTKLENSEKQLSKGEIQKIALARVLIKKPNILILDEPLSHIDEKSAEEILITLKDYCMQTNATIIIISHDNRVKKIADEFIFLNRY